MFSNINCLDRRISCDILQRRFFGVYRLFRSNCDFYVIYNMNLRIVFGIFVIKFVKFNLTYCCLMFAHYCKKSVSERRQDQEKTPLTVLTSFLHQKE